jgi:hypothetical protein
MTHIWIIREMNSVRRCSISKIPNPGLDIFYWWRWYCGKVLETHCATEADRRRTGIKCNRHWRYIYFMHHRVLTTIGISNSQNAIKGI